MARMKTAVLLTAALLLPAAAVAQQPQHMAAAPACSEAKLECARAATPAFAADGSLFLVWAAGGRVMVSHSTDLGHSFAGPVAVNPEPARIDTGPDARAKIAIDAAGHITVAYAALRDQQYNGRVMVSRSREGGASFAAPQPITDDAASQRFETLAIDPGSGDVFAAWIDKRDANTARAQGRNYAGAALAYSWSNPEGGFGATHIAADETCECCRLGVGFAGPHRPVVAFRNVFDGHTRDHAVITFDSADQPGPLHRVSVDGWNTDVCPHQGPSLAIAPGGTYHVTWFTAGANRKGLFYARSTDAGAHFSTPMPVGAAGHRAERPYVMAEGGKVWLMWKEFDGEGTVVWLMTSDDDGVSWSAPRSVATTTDASDHPLLVANAGRPFLSWLTKTEGYRLIDLSAAP